MARPASRKRTIDTAVLLIGGGPVGAVLAAAFDGAGVPTVVVDVRDPRIAPPDTFDGRAYAIALGSRRVLEGVGLWDALPEAPAPIDHIRVSDGESPLHLHYDHQALAGAPFGFMVEARFLGRAIAERLAGLGRVDVLAPARLEALERGEHGVTATLEDGRRIRARLAVGADGRNSWTRRSAGLRVSGWSYDQTAIVCTIGHKRDHGCVAHERFLPSGPFAILPLSGRHCSIVWTERAERAPAFLALDDEAFLAAVAERFGDFLGALRLVGPRWSYPLGLQFAERPVARRLALIGDAAHVIHPLAGQGLNMGIRDAAALAEVVVDAHRLGLDIGSTAVVSRFGRWRRFDNALMAASTDGINRLFSNDLGLLRAARRVGMAAVDRMPMLKRHLVQQAMGLAGDLPRLVSGAAL